MPHEQRQELTAEELAAQDAAELPEREEMSLINANVAAPINAAVALNVLSDNSTATANATQTAPIRLSSGVASASAASSTGSTASGRCSSCAASGAISRSGRAVGDLHVD